MAAYYDGHAAPKKNDLPWKKPASPGNYMSDGFKTMTKTGEPRSISDAELVQRIRHGDRPAFHELVDRYADYLFRLASSLVGNPADAEDILQETFAGAFGGLRSFRGQSSIKTWLARILVRQVARHYRTRSRHKVIAMNVGLAATEQQSVPSPTRSADVRMDVRAAIRSLSPEHREVIVFRELKGFSYDEIAEVLSVPRGTVESRLFRARGELRGLLKEYLSHE